MDDDHGFPSRELLSLKGLGQENSRKSRHVPGVQAAKKARRIHAIALDSDLFEDKRLASMSSEDFVRMFRAVIRGDEPSPVDWRGEPLIRLIRVPSWSRANYPAVYERDGHRCRYCGTTEGWMTVDHVVPRCNGGGDELENLVVACRSCNSRKSGRTPERAGMTLLPIGDD